MSDYSAFGTEVGEEIGWDDEIQQDSQEIIILPEGDYNFVVSGFERGRFNGSEKVPPCNQAKIKLNIETPKGTAVVFHNMFLNTKFEWQLSAFFCAIGQKKRGEKLRMDWGKVVGAKGRAKFGPKRYTNKNGNEVESNEVKKFYNASETPTPQASYKVGSF